MLDGIRLSDAAYQIQLRDRALIATAYVTAARRSELGALLLTDVEADGVEFRIRITRSKNQQTVKDRTAGVINSRTVRAADHLADWLTYHPLSGVPQAPLFVQLHRSGSCPDPAPLSGRGVARRIALWGDEVGQPGRSGHTTRRGTATDASRAGARIAELQQLGGWESTAMPAHYVTNADALLHHPLRGV